jgi:hypothetical protein
MPLSPARDDFRTGIKTLCILEEPRKQKRLILDQSPHGTLFRAWMDSQPEHSYSDKASKTSLNCSQCVPVQRCNRI